MITRIQIQNYRSFVDAEVKLRPFSLVVGANGSGKSNLLRCIALTSQAQQIRIGQPGTHSWQPHVNAASSAIGIHFGFADSAEARCVASANNLRVPESTPWARMNLPIYNINANAVSRSEMVSAKSNIAADGSGTAQVLESLKNGDREDLFDKIEAAFKRYVPEVEKLSLRTVEDGKKQIQVREKGLKELLPATELSEGTRLVLCILTILHQENPPPILLLEDIDRGLHPRLFEYVAPMMRDIAERHGINILATTHNPYLVDCFKDDKEAVIIVEKKDGASTLTTLADRMEGLDYENVDPEDMPLGNLWFSGLVGGVPAKIHQRPAN
jgi:predicted ATPase